MYDNLYYAEIFMPAYMTEESEIGFNKKTIVKKIYNENNMEQYRCLKTNKIYCTEQDLDKNKVYYIGNERITNLIPLEKCFNVLGMLKINVDSSVKKDIKILKKELKIRAK